MKRILLLAIVLLVGCTTVKPVCDVKVAGECREMSPGEKVGPGSRGHEETPKKPEYQMYVPPEELWPEDFKPAPKVCASPFQGNQLLR